MFAVLQPEPYRRRFAERLRPPKLPACVRTPVPDGVSFYTLHVPTCGTIPWERVAQQAGRLPILLPRGLTPTEGLHVFVPQRLPLLCAALTAGEMLQKGQRPVRENRLGILDPFGALCGWVSYLLPAAGDVRIVTRRPERFESDVRQAMTAWGAPLSVSDNIRLLQTCTDVVCVSTASLPSNVCAKTVFCLENGCTFPRAAVLSDFTLPGRCADLCPPQIDLLAFGAALYELCGVFSAAKGRFNHIDRAYNS